MKFYDSVFQPRLLAVFKTALFSMVLILNFSSCKEDDDMATPDSLFEEGVFITNEGPFSQGTGSVYFYDKLRDTLYTDIFQSQNGGQVLGNIVQSMYIHNERAYIVVNNANKIEVVDASTFKTIGTVDGLALPRKIIAVSPDQAFVSQWGADGLSGSIAVVDLNSLEVLSTIPCGSGPEDMLFQDGKVYVANSGGYGNDSTVVVIDVSDEKIENTIVVGDNPNSLAMGALESVWVLCRGYNDFVDPSNDRPGKLVQLTGTAIAETLMVENGAKDLASNSLKSALFFLSGAGIYQYKTIGSTAPPTILVPGFFYALGVDPQNNELYASDAKDFQSPGQVIRFDATAIALDTLTAGIIPGSFWFK